jgi:hypothetical protein
VKFFVHKSRYLFLLQIFIALSSCEALLIAQLGF